MALTPYPPLPILGEGEPNLTRNGVRALLYSPLPELGEGQGVRASHNALTASTTRSSIKLSGSKSGIASTAPRETKKS